jgi:hypothetical protein
MEFVLFFARAAHSPNLWGTYACTRSFFGQLVTLNKWWNSDQIKQSTFVCTRMVASWSYLHGCMHTEKVTVT